MVNPICLNDIPLGEYGRVTELMCRGGLRRRLLDIGLTPQTLVQCVGQSPGGDPRAYLIRGAVIALRREDACHILIAKEE